MDKEWTLSRQTLVAWRYGHAVPLDAVGEERLQPRDHRLGGSSKAEAFDSQAKSWLQTVDACSPSRQV